MTIPPARRRRRPDPPQVPPPRRLLRRAGPGGRVPGPRGRPHDDGRHRRRRPRQGPRPVRGRDEARALPVRRARRGGQADVPGPHRRLGRRHHGHRRRLATSRPASTRRCWPSPSRSSPRATPSSPSAAGKGASLGAGGAFAPFIRAYIHRSGAPEHIGWKVAVKDRLNALKNPYAHLKIEDISIEKVKESPMMWEPIRFLESCPSSDGAARDGPHRRGRRQGGRGRRSSAGVDPRHVVPLRAAELPRARPGPPGGLPPAAPTTSTRRPASPTPASSSTWPSCTCPFSWHEAIWLEAHRIAEPGDGWKMIDDGSTELGGSFPINASGGVLSSATRSGPRACSASPRRPTRSAAPPASTRSRAPRPPSPWPTAPTASTSACGSWPTASSPSAERGRLMPPPGAGSGGVVAAPVGAGFVVGRCRVAAPPAGVVGRGGWSSRCCGPRSSGRGCRCR